MMKLPKLMLLTAALVAANLSFAQTGVKADAAVGTSVTVPAVTATVTPAVTPTITPAATVSGGASASTDPYVQKREADSAAKKDFKMRKKMAKAEYKEEKAEAKSEIKSEKRMSASDRRAALAAEKKAGTPKEIGN